MEAKIVRVTDKGQISIPLEMRNSVGISKGDELFVVKNRESIILKKIKKSDFSDLLKHSEKVAVKLWDNKEDDIWDTV